ncbi:YciI family protein [Promicromonospora sukumoe]
MASDPDVPDAFDVYTVVVLRRPRNAPAISDDDLIALQERHLAYRADLRRQGVLVVNGPFDLRSDPSYRGMSIFACDPDEAARLSDADPSVIAGRLSYDVLEWWVAPGSLAFPLAAGQVGDRREMPDDD